MQSTAEYFILLLAGHLIGDFLFQSSFVATHKNRFPILLRHGLELGFIHAVTLLPAGNTGALIVTLPIVMLHIAIDAWKARRDSLTAFLTDQVVHLAVLALAATWLGRQAEGSILASGLNWLALALLSLLRLLRVT